MRCCSPGTAPGSWSTTWAPAARQWLAEHGFDPHMGARPMARLLQDKVKRPLADELLFGKLAEGGVVRLSVADGQLKVDCKAAEKLPAVVE